REGRRPTGDDDPAPHGGGRGRDLCRRHGRGRPARGYGEAITRRVLRVARDGGLRIAVLQAFPAGRGVYERIGFREQGRLRLHEWPATAFP
ncbi:MAG TPA: hypothetical protein VHM48_00070, partial [Candidatus Limnocylindrales bacterium]|nr:hypothetical protein [Candidatus Limnocylindrales bacterium]